MMLIGWILAALGMYGLVGVAFAAWFVVGGVGRMSPAARGTGWVFRMMILPGSAALWPLLVWELVLSRGEGGVIVGRAVRADDIETALEDIEATDEHARTGQAEIDPEAETSA